MLLWHGSRLTNWTGILSQGHSFSHMIRVVVTNVCLLAHSCCIMKFSINNCKKSKPNLYNDKPSGLRIAPPEAPVTGYMFGKGVYFADMFSKSANYCYSTHAAKAGVLLLCEVVFLSCRNIITILKDLGVFGWNTAISPSVRLIYIAVICMCSICLECMFFS
jgi:hypothetical protein